MADRGQDDSRGERDEDDPRGDAAALTAGYERLRAAVLSGEAGGWRLGHAVLCARGMTGWISAFGALAAPVAAGPSATDPTPASSEDRDASRGRPVSLPDAEQVVAVLAQMVLPLAA